MNSKITFSIILTLLITFLITPVLAAEMIEVESDWEASVFGNVGAVSYTHLRAHETKANLVCRLLLEQKKK